MTVKRQRECGSTDNIHKHPAFRGLVDDLEQESPDGVEDCLAYLGEEQENEDPEKSEEVEKG